MLEKDILKVLVTQEEIAEAVARLGKTLTEDYKDKEVVVVGILRGAAIFMADIIRAMDCYLTIDFMDVSSYGDAFQSSGEVKIVPAKLSSTLWTCSTIVRLILLKYVPSWIRKSVVSTIWKQIMWA